MCVVAMMAVSSMAQDALGFGFLQSFKKASAR
jgi:hypothetical protein